MSSVSVINNVMTVCTTLNKNIIFFTMKIRRKYLQNILVSRKIVLTNNMIDGRTVQKYHLIILIVCGT